MIYATFKKCKYSHRESYCRLFLRKSSFSGLPVKPILTGFVCASGKYRDIWAIYVKRGLMHLQKVSTHVGLRSPTFVDMFAI